MSKSGRVEETKNRLQKQWSCLNEKLGKLQGQKNLETRAEEKLRLDNEISNTKTEMEEIEISLDKIEGEDHFISTKDEKSFPMESTTTVICDKEICLNLQFEKYLVDTEITFQHRYKDKISLSDIYVYPHFKDLQEDIGKFKNIVDGEKLFGLDRLIGNYIIFAEEQLGKTSLSKMLFLSYFQLKALPLILRGLEINKSNPDKLLEKNIKNQYQSLSLGSFLNLNTQRIVIIDDFNLTKLNFQYQKLFIENLEKYFQHIIILADNEFKYVEYDVDYLRNFRKLEILPFGNLDRGKLINRWNSLGREETIDGRELHKLNDEVTLHINSVIRRNLIPLKPFFILTLLQSLESIRPTDYSLTSYGYCYQYLIIRSLESANILPQQIDTYINYLTELAFFIFNRKQSDISVEDFENEFAKNYSIKFFCKSHEVIINFLKNSQIIISEGDKLFFKYRYILYFFIAKYIADHIDDTQTKYIISKLCKDIHIEKNANILIFITHHTKNIAVLEEIQYKAIDLFSTEVEATLDQDNINFMKFVENIPSLEFDKPNIEEERRKRLQKEDEFEVKMSSSKEDEAIDQENDRTKLYLALINQAVKTIEIIGQIARNRYGSLNKKQLEEIIETAYSLGLRLLQHFLRDTAAMKMDIINTISDLIKEKTTKSDNETQDDAKKIFLLLCYRIMYSILTKIAFSIGSENIVDVYKNILEQKSFPSIKLVNLAIELQFTKKMDKKLIETFEKDFQSNPVCALILREIVVQYLYLHHVDYKDMQWIASTLRISMRSQRLIDATKTTKI